ncbi:MAG: glutathione S-transferase family protein [Gammaproteobacteria bacterium]
MTIELWHCKSARSLRPLWTLEELLLPYTLHLLDFPPRVTSPAYLEINPLGTVPYLRDGVLEMTESSAMCLYLATRYGRGDLIVPADHPDYGAFLNWLHHADATLTFPQTLLLRYGRFEPEARRQPQVVEDYTRWYLARLRLLNAHLANSEYLCADRFTVADIAITYALYLGDKLGLSDRYAEQTMAYLQRLTARPAFQRADAQGGVSPF